MEWTTIWGFWTQKQLDVLYAINGKIGCISCREVNNLGMRVSRYVIILARWAEVTVTSYGSTREVQLWSLHKKIREHKNSQVHKEAINILEITKKDVLKTRAVDWKTVAHFVHSRIAKLECIKRTNCLSIHCSSFQNSLLYGKK